MGALYLKQDFRAGAVSQVPASWYNKVAAFINHFVHGYGMKVTVPAEPSANAPVVVGLDCDVVATLASMAVPIPPLTIRVIETTSGSTTTREVQVYIPEANAELKIHGKQFRCRQGTANGYLVKKTLTLAAGSRFGGWWKISGGWTGDYWLVEDNGEFYFKSAKLSTDYLMSYFVGNVGTNWDVTQHRVTTHGELTDGYGEEEDPITFRFRRAIPSGSSTAEFQVLVPDPANVPVCFVGSEEYLLDTSNLVSRGGDGWWKLPWTSGDIWLVQKKASGAYVDNTVILSQSADADGAVSVLLGYVPTGQQFVVQNAIGAVHVGGGADATLAQTSKEIKQNATWTLQNETTTDDVSVIWENGVSDFNICLYLPCSNVPRTVGDVDVNEKKWAKCIFNKNGLLCKVIRTNKVTQDGQP